MLYRIFRRWISLVFVTTALCGLVYLAVQQSLRQGANDPQIQMAEDAAAALQTSTSTQDIVPSSGIVNINKSLAPYIVLYDASGRPIAGNGLLNNSLPNLPAGVFGYVAGAGEDRFTWQPAPDIRQAVVVTQVANAASPVSFAMVGRSLREVEIREGHVFFEVAAVWCFVVGGLLILEIIFAAVESWFWNRRGTRSPATPKRPARRSRS